MLPVGPAEAAGPGSCAAPCVTLQVDDGTTVVSSRDFSLDDVTSAHDLGPSVTYSTRSTAGGPEHSDLYPQPTSLRALVQQTTTDPSDVAYTEVEVPGDSYAHPLEHGELGQGADAGFEDGLVPAFFSRAPDELGYIRPLRGGDDVNAAPGPDDGDFERTDPSYLVVLHLTGKPLYPQVSTSPCDDCTFDVTFGTNGVPAGAATYAWDFGDGHQQTTTTPTVEHDYGDACAKGCTASLDVTAADGSHGSTLFDVSSDSSPSTPPNPPNNPPNPPNNPPNPPNNPPNPPTGPHHPSQGKHTRTQHDGQHSGDHHPTHPGTGTTPGTLGTPSSVPSSTATAPAAPTPSSSPTTSSATPAPSPGTPTVQGLLLAGAVTTSSPPGQEAESTGSPVATSADADDDAHGLSPYAWGGGGLLVLVFAAGMGAEALGARRLLARLRG